MQKKKFLNSIKKTIATRRNQLSSKIGRIAIQGVSLQKPEEKAKNGSPQ